MKTMTFTYHEFIDLINACRFEQIRINGIPVITGNQARDEVEFIFNDDYIPEGTKVPNCIIDSTENPEITIGENGIGKIISEGVTMEISVKFDKDALESLTENLAACGSLPVNVSEHYSQFLIHNGFKEVRIRTKWKVSFPWSDDKTVQFFDSREEVDDFLDNVMSYKANVQKIHTPFDESNVEEQIKQLEKNERLIYSDETLEEYKEALREYFGDAAWRVIWWIINDLMDDVYSKWSITKKSTFETMRQIEERLLDYRDAL
jgi:hypothetical protein